VANISLPKIGKAFNASQTSLTLVYQTTGIEFALFHVMGHLPEPESTHKFC